MTPSPETLISVGLALRCNREELRLGGFGVLHHRDLERELGLVNVLSPGQGGSLYKGEAPLNFLLPWRGGELKVLDDSEKDRLCEGMKDERAKWRGRRV